MAAVAHFVPGDRVPRLLDDPDVVVRLMAHAVLDTAPEAEITPAETRELVEAMGHVNRELAWAAGSMLVDAGDLASLAHALVGPDELARDASRAVLLDADPETVAPLAALQQGASRELRTAIDPDPCKPWRSQGDQDPHLVVERGQPGARRHDIVDPA